MALQSANPEHSTAGAAQPVPVTLNERTLEANRGIPLNQDWVEKVRVNTSAVERRAATHVTRRTVKRENQAAWLLRAIACMDLTTLSGDDSADRVKRLCAKARNPLQRHIIEGLGIEELHLTVGAVCVYHAFVETAVKAARLRPRSDASCVSASTRPDRSACEKVFVSSITTAL